MMNKKGVVALTTLAILAFAGAWYIGHSYPAKAEGGRDCAAGPGEICPSAEFLQELKALKALAERQRVLSQDPKVKELVSIIDQQRGMSERMQQEVNTTLQQNPGHLWDGGKEKFLPAPPPALPAPVPGPAPKK